MRFDLEDLYNVNIKDYLQIHGTTIDKLINKTKIDINLLKSHLKELVAKDEHLSELYEAVESKLDDKKEHLKRLENYKKYYKL